MLLGQARERNDVEEVQEPYKCSLKRLAEFQMAVMCFRSDYYQPPRHICDGDCFVTHSYVRS
jgi:hypothetical protein